MNSEGNKVKKVDVEEETRDVKLGRQVIEFEGDC